MQKEVKNEELLIHVAGGEEKGDGRHLDPNRFPVCPKCGKHMRPVAAVRNGQIVPSGKWRCSCGYTIGQ